MVFLKNKSHKKRRNQKAQGCRKHACCTMVQHACVWLQNLVWLLALALILPAQPLFADPIVTTATAPNPLILQQDFHHADLGGHLQYVHVDESPTAIDSLDAMLSNKNDIHWQTPHVAAVNLGLGTGTYWLRVRVDNTGPTDLRLLGEVSFLRFDDLSMYAINGDHVTTVYEHVGRTNTFANRAINHRHHLGYVTFPAHQTVTLYWRATTGATMSFPASLWQPDAFYVQDQIYVTAFAMGYGALLVLAIYNLFVFVLTRERSYLFYVLFILAQICLIMVDVGHISQWILPASHWPRRLFHTLAFTVGFSSFAQLTVDYLLLKTAAPVLRRYLQWLSYASAILLLGAQQAGKPVLEGIAVLMAILLYFSSVPIAWHIRRRGVVNAGFYLAACFMLVSCLLVSALGTFAIIPALIFNIGYQAVGTTAMGLLFSLALADRIKESQRRELAAVSALHKANIAKLAADALTRKAEIEIQAKNQFVATLSHEIRTPLNGVMGMADLLRATELDAQQRDYVDTIHSSGGLLLNVINDVLDYAKIEAGGMTLDAQTFEPRVLLGELQRIFGYLAQARNLAFRVSSSGDCTLAVVGDNLRLRQVLANLLSNALKFTERGEVELYMQMHRKENGRVALRFEIRDSGIGMSEAQQRHLFEPFSQVDNSSSRRFGGTGLGLSICRRLLHLMGGDITVESISGMGSLFIVTLSLPIADLSAPLPSALLTSTKPATAIRFTNLRVLVAEDNGVNVMVIKGILATFGIEEPRIARDGATAVAAASEKAYDLILMDCMMPTMDGYDATHSIREMEQNLARKRSIVIALSAHALPEFRDRALQSGMDDYLTKPIVRQTLENMLCKYFEPSAR